MRKPNGYGSIKHLSGRRRRPFVFVVSKDGHQRPVAYFATQVEAEIFAADYNKIHRHHSLPGHQITLIELLVMAQGIYIGLPLEYEQWGSYTESGGWNSHNFPVAFTNNCFAVMTNLQTPTDNYTGGPGTSIPCVKSITSSSFICSVNGGNGWRVRYIAIGY